MATVMLVHGMFLNPRSWQLWKEFFERRGYDCIAPAWPMHEGDPGDLRSHVPPGFSSLCLNDVVQRMEEVASDHEDLILVGHSVGGLVVQKLINKGIGRLGVAMCSMPPEGLFGTAPAPLRSVLSESADRRTISVDQETFYEMYGNTMHRLDSEAAWHRYVTPGCHSILRDCLGAEARVDTAAPHAPLLFVAAEHDRIIPPSISQANANAYTDEDSRTDYVEFAERGHFIQGQAHWQEVACYIDGWIRDVDAVTQKITRRTVERPRVSPQMSS
ncbi:MAG: alpha/beta hydrolase [Povalibacter sp.]